MTGRHVNYIGNEQHPVEPDKQKYALARSMPEHRAGDHPWDRFQRRFKISKEAKPQFPDSPWLLYDRRSGKTWHVSSWIGSLELAQALTR